MHEYIPYGQQWIQKDDIDSVISVLKSDWLTTGPKVKEYEKEFANYVGVKFAVAVSSGTAALHTAAFAAGIGPGDEVITTPMTFAASANSVLYQGGKPVFADIDKKTYNIDPKKIRERITDKTKAIIPVDYTGQPCDLDKIKSIAQEYDLIVIEDASHAVGSTYRGKKIGGISDISTFSFHPVKHITTGEGGIITTNSKKFYKKLLLFRNHGINREKKKIDSKVIWFYEQQCLGYNYRITDLQCALGLSQLKKLDGFISRRREIVKEYNEAFKETKEITIPYQADYGNSSWHLYVIRLDLDKLKVDRNTIFEKIRKKKIGVNVHYIPIYLHPYYQQLGYKKELCPNAEWLYERIITLPLYPKMTDDAVKIVINAVNEVLSSFQI